MKFDAMKIDLTAPIEFKVNEIIRCAQCSRRFKILRVPDHSDPRLSLVPANGHADASIVMSFCTWCCPTWNTEKIMFKRKPFLGALEVPVDRPAEPDIDPATCYDHPDTDARCGVHLRPRYHALTGHLSPTAIHRKIDGAIKKRVDIRLIELGLSDEQATVLYALIHDCSRDATHAVMELFSP